MTCSFAQRLNINDMADIYAKINKSEASGIVDVITSDLKGKAKGWSSPEIKKSSNSFSCLWRYNVENQTYGLFRFVVSDVNGKMLPKLVYEFPYESLYNDFISTLATAGELMDNSNQADGSYESVYKISDVIFILVKYPKGKYTLNGAPTAYYKVLMHPQL